MTTALKALFVGAAMVSVIGASSASAAVIITAFAGAPFSVSNPLGTIPATKMTTGNTYDYTFSLAMPLGTVSSMQLIAQKLSHGSSIRQAIQYSLYSGTPSSGVFQSQSSLEFAPTIAFSPAVGNYYVQVDYIAVSGEVAGGTITSAVPEPASWELMLLGFGALGVALRRRATKTASGAA